MFAHGVDARESIFGRLERLERLQLHGTAKTIEFGDRVHGSLEEGADFFEGDHLEERVAGGGFVKNVQHFCVTHDGCYSIE